MSVVKCQNKSHLKTEIVSGIKIRPLKYTNLIFIVVKRSVSSFKILAFQFRVAALKCTYLGNSYYHSRLMYFLKEKKNMFFYKYRLNLNQIRIQFQTQKLLLNLTNDGNASYVFCECTCSWIQFRFFLTVCPTPISFLSGLCM